jgi:hypothetical protein
VNLRSLILALMMLLVGCATTVRTQLVAPVVNSPSTWRQVDADIVAASQDAAGQAKTYARGSMDEWRTRIYERTEESFIPWFGGYWTQEWLSLKVSWYTLSAGQQKDQAQQRLTAYLQDQYHDRVLAPVAKEVDPDTIMAQTTAFYVQLLGKQLPAIAQRNGVPADQFDQRLKETPAIELGLGPGQRASLYQVVHTEPIGKVPAYGALLERIHTAEGGEGTGLSQGGISTVAKRTSETLESQIPTRSAVGAAAAVAGRVVGSLISVAVAGVRAVTHESERPQIESQLRKNLSGAFDEGWLKLMNDRTSGVMAGVYHLSGQIEGHLSQTVEVPTLSEPVAPPEPDRAIQPGG